MAVLRQSRCAKGICKVLIAIMASSGAAHAIDYEVWAFDQSNSVSGEQSRGVNGSFLWIWDSADVEKFVAGTAGEPMPLDCDGGATPAPCDML